MTSGPDPNRKGDVNKSDPADHLEEFAQGEIKVRHGKINLWLLPVYAILFIWAIYYLFVYCGGLGPGLDY